MKFKDVRLTGGYGGCGYSLSNEFPNTFDLTDAIEDAEDSNDLLERLKKIKSYIREFSLDRETPEYIRYKVVEAMCYPLNVLYLIVYKGE